MSNLVDTAATATWTWSGGPQSGRARLRKTSLPEVERRSVALQDVEFRDTDDGTLRFEGHAAVFDQWSEDLGGFREQIKRGAFRKALRGADVRLLLNHNPDLPMARSTVDDGPGSLRVSEDAKGLRVEAELVPTQAAQDLRKLMDAGVINQMSFAFSMRGGTDEWSEDDDGYLERTITEFGDVFDVSPVVFPAYPQTDASMRSLVEQLAQQISADGLSVEEAAALAAVTERCIPGSPWVAELHRRAAGPEPTEEAAPEGETGPEDAVGRPRVAALAGRLIDKRLAQKGCQRDEDSRRAA